MHRLVVVLAALAALVSLSSAPRAGSLPAEQRQAIEKVIEDYLVRNPEVIERALHALEAKREEAAKQAAAAAIETYRKELIESPSAPVGGNRDGDVTVVEFFDYRCPVCRRFHPIVSKLVETDRKIRRVFIDWPILGPDSQFAAEAALASRAQGKYLAFHDALIESRAPLDRNVVLDLAVRVGIDKARLLRDMSGPDVRQALSHNQEIAQALGLNGTPSFIIGGTLVRGGRDLAAMQQLVADARAAAAKK